MYSEWSTLPLNGGGSGVLGSIGGKEVVLAVIKQLASPEPSPLTTDAQVEWVLEVLRYGLSLPLSEHEALRECVRVCYAWLEALQPAPASLEPPPPAVPEPVARNPTKYATKILSHLHNLFEPRQDESADLVGKQAVLCHRVLRLARELAAVELGAEGRHALLALLLAAAHALLAAPSPPHAAAAHLCDRVLHVLFEVWILAAHRWFPAPGLWRTLRDRCLQWRHRSALPERWSRAVLALAVRLNRHMYGRHDAGHALLEEEGLVPADMSAEAVYQTWYRMLHTIGNPVELCRPHIISQTPAFLQESLLRSGGGRDQSQHPCLKMLPAIFLRAMKGVSAHVDIFLGLGYVPPRDSSEGPDVGEGREPEDGGATPPPRRLAKSLSHTSRKDKHQEKGPRVSMSSLPTGPPPTPPNSITSHVVEVERPALSPLRPKVNSLLHLFGEWLFEAALIGTPLHHNTQRTEGTPPPPSMSDAAYKLQMVPYQPGRAEALGTLCRVLCSRQWREEIHAGYLARSYVALHHGLRDPDTAPAVVLHAANLFRLDLDGVLVLVPDFVAALERILCEREPLRDPLRPERLELRRAAANALLSLVAFPLHYRGLPVPEFPGSNDFAGVTLGDYLRGKISMLCVSAVQTEQSSSLAVPLLDALYFCVIHLASGGGKAGSGGHRARSESSATTSESFSSLEDFAADVRDLDPQSPSFGAALVVRATSLVCNRLKSSWKGELQVSLAALQLLAGLAKLHSTRSDAIERKRAVRWICDYISIQCSSPPQAHSKDLHSCVVAAYCCLSSWLCPALLADRECLATLMEVVELGLSGSKSQGKMGEATKMKDEKELKPVSMRVRDAAESLLMLIMDQSGRRVRWWQASDRALRVAAGRGGARHVAAGAVLLTLLEEPLANSQDPRPTLQVVVRCPWGRFAWTAEARGAARSSSRGGGACARPVPMQASPTTRPPACRPPAPDPLRCAGQAFPALDEVLAELKDAEAPTLFRLLDLQAALERSCAEDQPTPVEFVPPVAVTEFQTARLFLSHFAFLNIGMDAKAAPPKLAALDSSQPGFEAALAQLDEAGSRLRLTALAVCVRAGQRTLQQILSNHAAPPKGFRDMLLALGKPVLVKNHPGWCGRSRDIDEQEPNDTDMIYYWSDAMTEIAYIVPNVGELGSDGEKQSDSLRSYVDGPCLSTRYTDKSSSWDEDLRGTSTEKSTVYDRSISECDRDGASSSLRESTRALSLDLDKHSSATNFGTARKPDENPSQILIVWLEDFEDRLHVPVEELTCGERDEGGEREDRRVVWVCAQASGLARVCAGSGAGDAGGVLATRVALAAAVRHASMPKLFQPPHVKRRHLIQELTQQFKMDLSEPELLESLFKPPL